eukprot:scaffold1010_cov334-Prasinococcus_capsulatus_cf.AAC.4
MDQAEAENEWLLRADSILRNATVSAEMRYGDIRRLREPILGASCMLARRSLPSLLGAQQVSQSSPKDSKRTNATTANGEVNGPSKWMEAAHGARGSDGRVSNWFISAVPLTAGGGDVYPPAHRLNRGSIPWLPGVDDSATGPPAAPGIIMRSFPPGACVHACMANRPPQGRAKDRGARTSARCDAAGGRRGGGWPAPVVAVASGVRPRGPRGRGEARQSRPCPGPSSARVPTLPRQTVPSAAPKVPPCCPQADYSLSRPSRFGGVAEAGCAPRFGSSI